MATVRQKQSTYAITILTFQRHRHFQRTANAELFLATLVHDRDAGKFRLHAYVIMPDHVHILLSPAMDQSTARIIQLIKGGYSHRASQQNIWNAGHYEHRIRDEHDFEAQKHYIAQNPSRKHLIDYPHVHTRTASALDPP